MPELPEVEHLRRTLRPHLVGGRVMSVDLRRRDVTTDPARGGELRRGYRTALLYGQRIVELHRRGKQMAIESDAGRFLIVQLGMSGQMLIGDGRRTRDQPSDHVHCRWTVEQANGERVRLMFRDPRRFGGLTIIEDSAALEARWASLGADALTIRTMDLRKQLGRTGRAVKTTLLDQRVVAGIGNIYADEILFAARVSPLREARSVGADDVRRIASATRLILKRAITAGGSTIRDYRDGENNRGSFADRHRVYGRDGQPCDRCRERLTRIILNQRSTTYCRVCQGSARRRRENPRVTAADLNE